ncbi:MAG: 16S rRNA (uracil(1498)-N(3))-methyltransferase [Clostridia bacterium]|nr:16S rRNA (uracil(1498)-N(3))-methyltransferase [Clostridia bacterium]
MHRFFAEWADGGAVLKPEEEKHALKVLRLSQGDMCQALIAGRIYDARIEETLPRVFLRVGKELPSTEPSVEATLYQGIPKGEKMDYIVQKCTEAGISRIVPVEFSRCVAKWEDRDAEKKQARFQRICDEAAKQSGRAKAPAIEKPVSLQKLCSLIETHDLCLLPWEEEHGHGIRACWSGHRNVGIVIGPEGGISPEEAETLARAGACPVTLGPRIFRTETAGLAALISLLTLSGDME